MSVCRSTLCLRILFRLILVSLSILSILSALFCILCSLLWLSRLWRTCTYTLRLTADQSTFQGGLFSSHVEKKRLQKTRQSGFTLK